jgi:hypothetical protein
MSVHRYADLELLGQIEASLPPGLFERADVPAAVKVVEPTLRRAAPRLGTFTCSAKVEVRDAKGESQHWYSCSAELVGLEGNRVTCSECGAVWLVRAIHEPPRLLVSAGEVVVRKTNGR